MVGQRPVAAPRAQLPDVADLFGGLTREEKGYMREFNAAVQSELDKRLTTEQPVYEILLMSSSGSVFSVTVSNTGVLVITPRYQSP